MKIIATLFLFILLSTNLHAANFSTEQMKQGATQFVTALNLHEYQTRIKNGKVDPNLIQVIYSILENTPEVYIHRQRGATENQIFLAPDGHSEAVYGADGKLVKDGINDGTYNFFYYKEEPLLHYSFDTHPWIVWGMSRKDLTTVEERIYNYMGDLEIGIVTGIQNYDPKRKVDLDKPGQAAAVSVFLKAIEKGDIVEPLSNIKSKKVLNDTETIKIIKGFHKGFLAVY